MAKILVTGGAGFIGSHVVDELVRKKHKVVVIDNLTSGYKKNVNPKSKLYQCNVASIEIKDIFRKEKFDYVFHLAAQINVRASVDNPGFDAQQNILGSINLLENAVKGRIKKFIFVSTGGAIYGDTKTIPTPETHKEQPVSPYGIGKLAVEKYLNYYSHQYGLKYTILRFANVYGPRQNAEGEAGVISIFLSKLLKNKQTVINGTGLQTRDYVYVRDVVRAVVMAISKNGVIFNIGTGKETNVNQLFDKIVQIGEFKVTKQFGPSLPGEQMRSCLNAQKISRQWGFKPQYSLAEGLRETIHWFKNESK